MPELFSYELELNPARRGPSAFAVEGNLRKDLEARIRATDAPDYETGEARPRTFGLILERSSRGSVKPPALVVDPPFSSEEGHPVVDPRDGVTKPQFFVMRRASSRTEDAFEVRRSARTGKDYGVVAALISRFSLFSNTSKMSCPSWSLPAGHSSVGGSCPTAAQYHLRPSTRNGVLRLLEASQAALWNRPLPAEATMEENRKGEERLKSNVICDFCVAGDTLLLVRNGGLLPLSDVVRRVEQGEAVEVNDRGRWVKVTRSWRKGTRSVVRITTTCGLELVCTPDHKIMTTDGWVEAGELVPHDHLVLSSGLGHTAAVSVAASDPVDVYDIEVDHPDHAFGAAGLCVSNCYAGKGNYGNLSTQLAQSLRFEWLKDVLSEGGPAGAAELLAQAVRHQQAWIARTAKRREALNPRFFRIHDSGDFHNYDALETWIRVARLLPDVHFWAPTRMHHFPNFLEAAAEAPENLSIRPSVLLVGDVPPDLRDYPGFSGGTTVAESRDLGALSQELDALIWDCPVYMRKGRDKTCRASTNPQGKPHCRVCWGGLPKANGLHKSEKFKQAFVNYHPH